MVFTRGFLRENPLLALLLGACPALAVTTSAINGLGMGLAATFVLLCSNLVISLLRKAIPDKVRIPAYITIIASFVTILKFLLQAYLPELDKALGIFIPLITVNCIILGRAEAFAGKNPPLLAVIDGLGMGLGFTGALFLIGVFREVLGNGSIFGLKIPGLAALGLKPMTLFILPPGGFIVFGILIAISQQLINKIYANEPYTAEKAPRIQMSKVDSGYAGMERQEAERRDRIRGPEAVSGESRQQSSAEAKSKVEKAATEASLKAQPSAVSKEAAEVDQAKQESEEGANA
ncbi:MAG: electron transport complex subunit RsxE [Eubacteriales bacterium]|nr:electron transport complex subunit RsxE [Eubacteriales bacterium]